VGLGPTAGVRLERALAHEVLPLHDIDGAYLPVGGCAERPVRAIGLRTPRSRVTGSLRPEPSTDSAQHNRGSAQSGDRADVDRPCSLQGTRSGQRHAAHDAPGRLPGALPGCGRGC
jgi:hypothetical protein